MYIEETIVTKQITGLRNLSHGKALLFWLINYEGSRADMRIRLKESDLEEIQKSIDNNTTVCIDLDENDEKNLPFDDIPYSKIYFKEIKHYTYFKRGQICYTISDTDKVDLPSFDDNPYEYHNLGFHLYIEYELIDDE